AEIHVSRSTPYTRKRRSRRSCLVRRILVFFFSSRRRHTRSVSAFLLNRSSDLLSFHITIIELNALHTKRQNLFQELDAVIHLLMEAKHWGLRKSRNATSLNSRFKDRKSVV